MLKVANAGSYHSHAILIAIFDRIVVADRATGLNNGGDSGIVCNNSIQIAGDDFTEDIQEHMRRAHNVKVGERMAELIKINVGSALTELENPPEDFIVHGPNQMTALPMEIPVS